MDALKLGVGLAALMSAATTHADVIADRVSHWQPFITEAATRFAVPSAWIVRVMRAESAGLTEVGGQPIRSRAGAIGLMQLMPATWATMRTRYRLGANPDDPHDNIIAGTAFLRQMYDRFGFPGAFAAYNAGPARYEAFLARRSQLPGETVAYLAAVTRGGGATAITTDTPPHELLFALRHDLTDGARSPTDRPRPDGLFAVRKAVP